MLPSRNTLEHMANHGYIGTQVGKLNKEATYLL